MSVTLVLPELLFKELAEMTRGDLEAAGVLLARLVEAPGGELRLLAREIRWVPDKDYIVRKSNALSIASTGYVPALQAALETGMLPIWFHTHPGGGSWPKPSQQDDTVDKQIASLFRWRSENKYYGSLILAPSADYLAFTGRLEDECGDGLAIDRLWVVGSKLYLAHNWFEQLEAPGPNYDRNVRAFGGGVQRTLSDITVAVIGCGGTGSSVAEQLVRLGVRRFLLVDPDELSGSNVTRVYGSTPADIGRPKAELLAGHLQRIAPDADVTARKSSIIYEDTARELIGSDVVFGCTDDNAGRLVLSRLSTYFVTPVIDCGVLIFSGPDGIIEGIYGRVTVLYPGAACLVCRNRIDIKRAAAETMSTSEYERLAGEGYAPALPGAEPAVVAFTTQVAAAAVGELVERLVHYGPSPNPSEILLRIHDREISTNEQDPRVRHYCHPDSGKFGLGRTEPFLEQTWPQ